ncbi:TIGR04283 family arsenosugar biosynthesis glycosyltransferase [Alkalilimnicola ehrlichii MLHE-1]|uniref:Glycosyl transferase, family 2 n=1 Tax=Alkalilimnicola ehrlichii (strain ATCC BAA-1101 / DSM 17681 / MLHE-1) TaxID=187272 RepID=Q0AAM8_ALKEH|nr:TIGR04283 family arsenosugar biosynthesis glycosyltransferase [Alkalilimnicola ehrlichii]ABI56109.1 glycosyl transferase, family 2 [Alkalilimnicola ehrlichii MLHE-1]
MNTQSPHTTPPLSVIVPVLNEAGQIPALARNLRSTALAPGHEILLVDGGSHDDTPAAAQAHGLRMITATAGRARQLNAGARATRHPLLLFLHADTRLPAGADRLVQQALGAPAPVWGRFDVTISGRHPLLPVVAALMNRRSRLTGIATGDQALFMRREAFDAVGGFPDQPLMEDIEMSRRLKRLGPPACLPEQVLTSGRRWERHGVAATILLMWRLRFDYWRGVPADRLAQRYR